MIRKSLPYKIALITAKSAVAAIGAAFITSTLASDSSARGQDANEGAILLAILVFFIAITAALIFFAYWDLFRKKKGQTQQPAADKQQGQSSSDRLSQLPAADKIGLILTIPATLVSGSTVSSASQATGLNLFVLGYWLIGYTILLHATSRLTKLRWTIVYLTLLALLPPIGYIYGLVAHGVRPLGGYLMDTRVLLGAIPADQSYVLYESTALIGIAGITFMLLRKKLGVFVALPLLLLGGALGAVHAINPLTISLDRQAVVAELDAKTMRHYINPGFTNTPGPGDTLADTAQNTRNLDSTWQQNVPSRSDHYPGDTTDQMYNDSSGQLVRLHAYLEAEITQEYSLATVDDLACQLQDINNRSGIIPDALELQTSSTLESCQTVGAVTAGLYFSDRWAMHTSFIHEDNVYAAEVPINTSPNLSAQQVAQTAEYTSHLQTMDSFAQGLVQLPQADILDLVYADRHQR